MPYERLNAHLTQFHLNQVFTSLEKQAVLQQGAGVLSGCMIVPKGDVITVTGGNLLTDKVVEVADLDEIAVPQDDGKYKVWRAATGEVLFTDFETKEVGGLYVCVGSIIKLGHSVYASGEGRWEPPRVQVDDRQSFVFRGELLPKGALHHPVMHVGSGETRLTLRDRNIVVVEPNWTGATIVLPPSPHWGNWFRIINAGAPTDASVKIVYGDNDLLLNAGDVVEFRVVPLSHGAKVPQIERAKALKASKNKPVPPITKKLDFTQWKPVDVS